MFVGSFDIPQPTNKTIITIAERIDQVRIFSILSIIRPQRLDENLFLRLLSFTTMITRRSDRVDRAQLAIQQTRANAGVHFVERVGCGDDGF